MNQNRNNQRPASRNDRAPGDPTNTASLPQARHYEREDLTKIFVASAEILGLDPALRPAFGSAHRVMALARTALIVAGAKAEAAEAAGTLPGSAWASARDFHFLVFNTGTPVEKSEERKDRRDDRRPAAQPRPEADSTLGDTLSPERRAELVALVAPPRPMEAEADAPRPRNKSGRRNGTALPAQAA